MSEYLTEIKGDNSLTNIELAIAGEEAAGAKFMRTSISFHAGEITNLVTFDDLPPGQRPTRPLILVKQGDILPAGTAAVWGGVMLVARTNMAVVAAR